MVEIRSEASQEKVAILVSIESRGMVSREGRIESVSLKLTCNHENV